MSLRSPGGGRLTVTNFPLDRVIRWAYRLQGFQLVGAGWTSSDRFDIIAKAEDNPPPDERQLQLMMRTLLADRFKLTVHSETRELPIYALALAGKLGANVRPSTMDCAAVEAAVRTGGAPPAPRAGERPLCGININGNGGNLIAGGVTMSQVALNLSSVVGRTVVDRTALNGAFDLDLHWMPDQLPQQRIGTPEVPPIIDPNGASIFTALQEQLGLKLESTKGPVDVLVIDHVEQPTPD
jgi:uncharacterized protein (TIGR03435 family)